MKFFVPAAKYSAESFQGFSAADATPCWEKRGRIAAVEEFPVQCPIGMKEWSEGESFSISFAPSASMGKISPRRWRKNSSGL